MNLSLYKLTPGDEAEFTAYFNEFKSAGGRMNPGITRHFSGDFAEFLEYIGRRSDPQTLPSGYVESDTYAMKDENGRIYGMSSLRRRLDSELLFSGGHIAYGIRPSERRAGLGTRQLALLLEKCAALGIYRVLVTCDSDNPASAGVIKNNGGVLENTITDEDGKSVERYWISLRHIRALTPEELPAALGVIHESFATVAAGFALTRANCPGYTGFMPLGHLLEHQRRGWYMFGHFDGDEMTGYASVSMTGEGVYELHNLAVLPRYRRAGRGGALLAHAAGYVRERGGNKLTIGIIDGDRELRQWYASAGFVRTGTASFAHLPFTVGYMELDVQP